VRLVSGKWKVCFRGRGNASLRAPVHPSRLAQGGWAGRPGDRAARGRGTCPLNASAAAAAFFPSSVRRRGLHVSLATHAPQTLHTLQPPKPALTWLPLASPRPEGPVPERVRGILLGAVFVLRGGGQASARKKGIASLSFLLQVVPSGSERERVRWVQRGRGQRRPDGVLCGTVLCGVAREGGRGRSPAYRGTQEC